MTSGAASRRGSFVGSESSESKDSSVAARLSRALPELLRVVVQPMEPDVLLQEQIFLLRMRAAQEVESQQELKFHFESYTAEEEEKIADIERIIQRYQCFSKYKDISQKVFPLYIVKEAVDRGSTNSSAMADFSAHRVSGSRRESADGLCSEIKTE